MKGYIKLDLILEVESGDLEDFQVEDWVLDEIDKVKIHKDIKIVEQTINSLEFNKGIKSGCEDLF